LSPEKCIVVVIVIILLAGESRRLGFVRKAAALNSIWQEFRIPPGSETRACSQRGGSGTWETQTFPYIKTVRRIPSEKVKLLQRHKVLQPLTLVNKQLKHIRYRGRIANSEQTRDRLLGVLVDHSTGVSVISGTGWWGSGTQSDPL